MKSKEETNTDNLNSQKPLQSKKKLGIWPYALVAVRTFFICILIIGGLYEVHQLRKIPLHRIDITKGTEIEFNKHGRHYIFYEHDTIIDNVHYTGQEDISNLKLDIIPMDELNSVGFWLTNVSYPTGLDVFDIKSFVFPKSLSNSVEIQLSSQKFAGSVDDLNIEFKVSPDINSNQTSLLINGKKIVSSKDAYNTQARITLKDMVDSVKYYINGKYSQDLINDTFQFESKIDQKDSNNIDITLNGKKFKGKTDSTTLRIQVPRTVDVLEPSMKWEYDLEKHKGKIVAEFWIRKPGVYKVIGSAAEGSSNAFCISQKLPTAVNPIIVYIVFCAAPALIIFIVIILLTRRVRKRQKGYPISS